MVRSGYNVGMFSRLLSLVFPPTAYEQLVAHTQTLALDPATIRTPQGVPIYTCTRDADAAVHATIRVHKKHGVPHTTQLLARALADVLLEELADTVIWNGNSIIIVPIPQSKKRTRERGFEHLHSICDALPKELKRRVRTDVLVTTRSIPMQKRLTRTKRIRNVAGAFAVAPHTSLQGMQVIVYDDVVTTGATLAEATRVLTHAGAVVTARAIARA